MQETTEIRTFQQAKAERTKARSFILSKAGNSLIAGDKDSKSRTLILQYLINLTARHNTTIYTGTNRNLAIDTNLSESTVKRILRELVHEGLIIPPQYGQRRGIRKDKTGQRIKNGYDIAPLYDYLADPKRTENANQKRQDRRAALNVYKEVLDIFRQASASGYTEDEIAKRREELDLFYNWIHRKGSESALIGLKALKEEIEKDLRRLTGEAEEAEEEVEIAEKETQEQNSEIAENSALKGCRVGHFDPLSIFMRLSFTSERGKKIADSHSFSKKLKKEPTPAKNPDHEIEFNSNKEQKFLSMDAFIRDVSAIRELKKALNRDVISWEEWKANAKTAAKSIYITAEQWHKAGEHGEDYRSLALLATLKQAERFNLKDPKGIFALFTCRKDVGRVWNELEHIEKRQYVT